MRSIFFCLEQKQPEIEEELDALCERVGSRWCYPNSIEAVLWIELNDQIIDELEEELLTEIQKTVGVQFILMAVDISSRIEGTREVKRLATRLLSKFKGVAINDMSNHLWTLSEIERELKIDGFGFLSF